MKKEDRVVFSKFPAPGDKQVQWIFKGYQIIHRNIIRSLNNQIRLDDPIVDRGIRPNNRIKMHRKEDGTYIPILSRQIRLSQGDMDKIQLYEGFFSVYRDLRQLTIDGLRRKMNGPYYDRSLSLTLVKFRMYTVSVVVKAMMESKLTLDDVRRLGSIFVGDFAEDKKLYVEVLAKRLNYHPTFRSWDTFGVIQQSWWEYVAKCSILSAGGDCHD